MELTLLDENFRFIKAIDIFNSLIWVERYSSYGDFELSLPLENNLEYYRASATYLSLDDSDRFMIVESREIRTSSNGDYQYIVKGRSLESILLQKIVWDQTVVDGNLQTIIQAVLTANIISPTESARTIDNFVYTTSTDPAITGLSLAAEFSYITIHELIENLCNVFGIGFKISLDTNGDLNFSLYAGKDRSYYQVTNPFVVFSANSENLLNSEYAETKENYKNVALVVGEGEGSDRLTKKVTVLGPGGQLPSGLSRYEMYVDASDISRTTSGGTIPEADYLDILAQRGYEELAKQVYEQRFEGSLETQPMYIIGTDFNLGDIVELTDIVNHSARARVTEVIYSEDPSGVKVIPTFKAMLD